MKMKMSACHVGLSENSLFQLPGSVLADVVSEQRGISATNDSQDTKLFVQFVTPSDAIKRFPSRQILAVIDVCSLYS